jgi:hypothetical protein
MKKSLFVISVALLLSIILVQFASAATSSDMYVDCITRGGWIYNASELGLGIPTSGTSICVNVGGINCAAGYSASYSTIACGSSGSYACCTSKPSSSILITQTGSSCSGYCPSGTSFSAYPGCNYLIPCYLNSVGGGCVGIDTICYTGCYFAWQCSCISTCSFIGVKECTGGSTDYWTRRQCTLAYKSNIGDLCGKWQDLAPCTKTGQVCYRGDCCTKLTCSAYPGKCGTSLSDGCGGTINCAGNCVSGQSCSSGTCVAGCTNQCSFINAYLCGTGTNATKYKKCGDWNGDGCSEWNSTYTDCQPAGYYCFGTGEVPKCGPYNCSIGQTDCKINSGVAQNGTCINVSCIGAVCVNLPYPEWIWSNCPSGQTCSNGQCTITCTDTTWTWDGGIDPSQVCIGQNATRTSNCGTKQQFAGTKNCCKLTNASWANTTATILTGIEINMTVNGTDCGNGEQINLTIYRQNLGINQTIAFVNAVLIGNTSIQNFTAPLLASNYSFNVSLAFNTSVFVKDGLLVVVSAPPVVSCGNGSIDAGEDCDNSAPSIFRASKDTCNEFDSIFTVGIGTLKCYNDCTFNTTGCISAPAITTCEEYGNNQAGCGGLDAQVIAQSDIRCTTGKVCGCYWNGTACEWSFTASQGECNYRCVKSVKNESTCDETTGMKSVTLKADVVPIWPSTPLQCTVVTDCVGGDVEAPCGLITADLPFFGWFNFAIALLAITIIYVYYRRLN